MTDFRDEKTLSETVKDAYRITANMRSYRTRHSNMPPVFDQLDENLSETLSVEISEESYMELCNTGRLNSGNQVKLYSPDSWTDIGEIDEDLELYFERGHDETVPVEVLDHSYENLDIAVPTWNSFRREVSSILKDLQEEP